MTHKKINVGGQAVIEGVMIRGQSNYVVGVRKNKKIITKKEALNCIDKMIKSGFYISAELYGETLKLIDKT